MILAIDYGTKRIGIAISDEKNIIAFKKQAIIYKDLNMALNSILKILLDNKIELIILGIPLDTNQNETRMSLKIREFAQTIKQKINIEILFWNESMTSKMAQKFTKNDKTGKIDSESARILLQEYLDFKNQK